MPDDLLMHRPNPADTSVPAAGDPAAPSLEPGMLTRVAWTVTRSSSEAS
ncbi:hypothetical protein ACWDTG_26280 [Rhodococcus zopfii]|nr:hypothetical protein [Rhodococcus zopfii]